MTLVGVCFWAKLSFNSWCLNQTHVHALPALLRDDQRETQEPAERAKQVFPVFCPHVDRPMWTGSFGLPHWTRYSLVRKKKAWDASGIAQWLWVLPGIEDSQVGTSSFLMGRVVQHWSSCPGRRWTLRSWRHSKPSRTPSWVTCSSRTRSSPKLL